MSEILSRELGNEICDACYKWVKGDGPEPYSPAVASLVVMVAKLCERAHAEGLACAPEIGAVT